MLPPVLQKAQVFPVSESNCKLVMGSERIKPGMICAAGGGTDTCQVGRWWWVSWVVDLSLCRGIAEGLW